MAASRPPPAPASGRKPQTDVQALSGRRKGPVVGPHLNHLVWLQKQGIDFGRLADQERTAARAVPRSPKQPDALRPLPPSPLTGSVRLRPGDDPLLPLAPGTITRSHPGTTFDPDSPSVEVIIEFFGSARDLPLLGFIPAVHEGDLFAGWVNLERVEHLARHPAVVRVEVLRTLAPDPVPARDVAVRGNVAGGPAAAGTVRPPDQPAATGRGVRLSVIDLGFDFMHAALVDENEQVRTLWLHDMGAEAPPGTLGVRFGRDQLQAALDWYNDAAGRLPGPAVIETYLNRLASPPATNPDYTNDLQLHGTAVVGIAAGNGRGEEAARPSLAPDANLALIAIGGHDETRFADSVKVLAAFQAAFEGSEGLNEPTVALMANSDNLGPHDGSLDGERFLDELLLYPGRAIVLSAGNLNHVAGADDDGDAAAWHAMADTPGEPLVLEWGDGAAFNDAAEVWFKPDRGDRLRATISIEVRGRSIGPPITVIERDAPLIILDPNDEPNLQDRTTVTVQLQYDSEADAFCLRLVFRPDATRAIVPSKWTIHVPAEGRVHGWLDRNNGGIGRWVGATADAGAGITTLGSPASAMRPLAVGSVRDMTGLPSTFSGCGPLRASRHSALKPDLVAVGENVSAPVGRPFERRNHLPVGSSYAPTYKPGTSFAAPHVAGACALLFERFGPGATWADIRQAVLQATVRPPGMPLEEVGEWDRTCGHGRLDIDKLLSPPPPGGADLWLPKAADDRGTEPFVAETFWHSPSLVLEDAAGTTLEPNDVATGRAVPERLRVRLLNRGARDARDIALTVWWAPVGAIHPLPHRAGGGSWQTTGFIGPGGHCHHVASLAPGHSAEVVFKWVPPRDENGGILPHVLLATVDSEDDPYDASDTICAHNNVAALTVAAGSRAMPARFQIHGTNDVDGIIVWCDNPGASFTLERLPVTALPWRDAAMFERAGRRDRPLYGTPGHEDMAIGLSAQFDETHRVRDVTDILGAEKLKLAGGSVSIEASSKLIVPRLRIAETAPLIISTIANDHTAGAIHLLHLSGGRRVGGGTVRFVG